MNYETATLHFDDQRIEVRDFRIDSAPYAGVINAPARMACSVDVAVAADEAAVWKLFRDMAPAYHCHKCSGWGAVKVRGHHRMCSRRGE